MDITPSQASRLPLEAALGWVRMQPACGTETAEPSAGRVLGQDIIAFAGLPETAMAAWDGWACRAQDTEGASDYAPLWAAGQAMRAGDTLPADLDAVIPTELAGASILAPVAKGMGVLWPGSDVGPGAVALPAGLRLDPAALALLAILGLSRVSLQRQPRVALVVGRVLQPMLLAAVTAAGGIGETLPAEDGAHWARAGRFDAVVLTDTAGLAEAGGQIEQTVAILPGEAAYGRIGGAPLLVLPALPMPCLAAFRLLGAPLLRQLARQPLPEPVPARLTRKISSPLGVTELVWVRLVRGMATPVRGQGLASALGAGHVVVPPESEGHEEGAQVLVWA